MLGLLRKLGRNHAACGGAFQLFRDTRQQQARIAGFQQGILNEAADGEIRNRRQFNQHVQFLLSTFSSGVLNLNLPVKRESKKENRRKKTVKNHETSYR